MRVIVKEKHLVTQSCIATEFLVIQTNKYTVTLQRCWGLNSNYCEEGYIFHVKYP